MRKMLNGFRPKKIIRDENGATAVEFALLATVFFSFMAGILELGLMFATTVVVDGAMQDAARQIRTGQAQSSGNALTTFQNTVCASLSGFYSCNGISYDVRTFSSFSTISMPIELDDDGNPETQFNAGSAGDIMAVRVLYYYDFFMPLLGKFFEDSAGANRRLLTTTVVFRNEPFE